MWTLPGSNFFHFCRVAPRLGKAADTDKLRDSLRKERGDTELFSYGGTIEEIKAASLEETHMPAPEAPNA